MWTRGSPSRFDTCVMLLSWTERKSWDPSGIKFGCTNHKSQNNESEAMRLLTERWFIVPGLAMCTAYFAFVSSMEQSAVKSERISLQTVDDVYSLARADNYGELLSKHLLNESDIDYLKMQDACFGRIEQWSLVGQGDFDSSGDPFGGWSHRMNVTRPLADFVENARGSSLHEASISLAYYSDRLI